MKHLLPIGQFATLSRLSIKTLRYYDRIGLLMPAHIDSDSGFRYYSVSQSIEAEQIRLLRSLDMPIDDVRAVLGETDRAKVRQQLANHRERVAERLAETQQILAYLERLLDNQEDTMTYEIKIKTAAAQPILSVRKRTDLVRIGVTIHDAIGLLFAYAHSIGVAPSGPPGTIYLDEDLDKEEDLDIEVYLPVERRAAGDTVVKGRELPATTVAYTLHVGPFSEVGAAYPALYSWIRDRGHSVTGPPREVYLRKGDKPKDNRAEIVWPIDNESERN